MSQCTFCAGLKLTILIVFVCVMELLTVFQIRDIKLYVSNPQSIAETACNMIRLNPNVSGSKRILPSPPPVEKVDIPWEKVLSFAPTSNNACNKLFLGADKTNLPYPQNMMKEIKAHEDHWKKVKSNHTDWKQEGHIGKYLEQGMAYYEIAHRTNKSVNTICETGFNAGHSVLHWLVGNTHAKVYSFDLGVWHYSKDMAKYLGDRFPGRLMVTWGDSTETLPEFHRKNPDVKCDMVVIDGGHTQIVAQADLANFVQMSRHGSIVIIDDYPDPTFTGEIEIGVVWERARRKRLVNELFRCQFESHIKRGFSLGWIDLINS